jgi:hypothetical protein
VKDTARCLAEASDPEGKAGRVNEEMLESASPFNPQGDMGYLVGTVHAEKAGLFFQFILQGIGLAGRVPVFLEPGFFPQ